MCRLSALFGLGQSYSRLPSDDLDEAELGIRPSIAARVCSAFRDSISRGSTIGAGMGLLLGGVQTGAYWLSGKISGYNYPVSALGPSFALGAVCLHSLVGAAVGSMEERRMPTAESACLVVTTLSIPILMSWILSSQPPGVKLLITSTIGLPVLITMYSVYGFLRVRANHRPLKERAIIVVRGAGLQVATSLFNLFWGAVRFAGQMQQSGA